MTEVVTRTELIAAILQQVADIGRQLAAARTRPFGERRLSRSQLDALFILSHASGQVTAGDLAESLAVTPGAVTQLVAGLREAGLVETVTPEGDGRVRVIRLTASARAHVDAFEREQVARLAPRFDALDQTELKRLAALLAKGHERE